MLHGIRDMTIFHEFSGLFSKNLSDIFHSYENVTWTHYSALMQMCRTAVDIKCLLLISAWVWKRLIKDLTDWARQAG